MKTIKKALASLLAFSLMLALTPTMAFAAGEQTLDLSNGSIVITSTGYSQGGGAEIPHVDGYIITGSTTTNTIQVNSGSHDITLNNAVIAIPAANASSTMQESTYCAFFISGNADVALVLEGANNLTSAAGYAGLHVEQGSSLAIGGVGDLTARGGGGRNPSSGTPVYGGGAGIGGSGYNGSHSFGTITVDSGTITATGGATSANTNYGAGAGIGSGGMSSGPDAYPIPEGTVTINGGVIDATGGACVHIADTGGGAGIGAGGIAGSNWEPAHCNVVVTIHDGLITARGDYDGAGIGGGANCNSGTILIDGGQVFAYGEGEKDGSGFGGAGIGGGDNGCASSISIGGDAVVFAQGAGAAAGIGGGNDGAVGIWEPGKTGDILQTIGTITLYGNAEVTAIGSSPNAGIRGGAGIGAGRSNSLDNPCGIIAIQDSASVTAYAGRGAQAIGVGSTYDYAAGFDCELQIDSTISLQAFNQDTVQPVYTPNVTGTGAASLVSFVFSDSGLAAFPNAGERVSTTSADSFTWEYSGTPGAYELRIYDNTTLLATLSSTSPAFGNWTVMFENPFYTVTYDANGGSGVAPTETDKEAGDTFAVASNTFIAPPGKQFKEWNTAADGSGAVYAAADIFTMPANNVTFYATWENIPLYNLTVVDGTDITAAGPYLAGALVIIEADPAPAGQVFDKWETSGGGTFRNAASTITIFTMPAADTTVTATYKIVPFTYTLAVINGSGSGAFPAGMQVTITADPPQMGYVFDRWQITSGSVIFAPTDQTVTFNMPAGNVAIVATYKLAPATHEVIRLAGNEAPETSVEISKESFPHGSNVAILARADDFQDAMSATGLAGALDAPILLTDRAALSASVRAEIERLGATKIYVAGGTGALFPQIDADLISIASVTSVERVWGHYSWDTSVKCAELIRANGGSTDKVIVAMSMNFQDALSISSFAYKYKVPIFLQTAGENAADRNLPAEAISMIDLNGNSTIYVPGGIKAVSEASVEDIFGASRVVRIWGNDGYDTSNAIAKYMTDKSLLSATVAVFACGAQDPQGVDALAGAALAGKNDAAMLLANENTKIGDVNTVTLDDFLVSKASSLGKVYVLGGTFVMPESFIVKIKAALGW